MQDSVGGAASLSATRSRAEVDARRRRSNGFDEPILRLLLNGAPDKAIAARLRVSERTVQRHVRMLLAKLGAHNRMQLGQILARQAHPRTKAEPESQPASARTSASASQSASAPAHEPRLTAFDAQVLALLLQGLPESSIAEALSVSRRTVQRAVKGLMSRTGAANRVQLGWHAQLNGWI